MPKVFCRNCGRITVLHVEEPSTAKACVGCGLIGQFSDTHPKPEYSTNDRKLLKSLHISAEDLIDDPPDDGA